MRLIRGRRSHPVDRALDIVTRQETQRIAAVDGECPRLGLCPFPLAGDIVLDLQRSDVLSCEQSV